MFPTLVIWGFAFFFPLTSRRKLPISSNSRRSAASNGDFFAQVFYSIFSFLQMPYFFLRPYYSSWSWGSRGSQGSQNPHFEGIRSPGSHGSPYLLHDLQTDVDRSKVKEQLTKFGKVNLANNMLLLMNFQLSLSLIKSSLNLFPNAHAMWNHAKNSMKKFKRPTSMI